MELRSGLLHPPPMEPSHASYLDPPRSNARSLAKSSVVEVLTFLQELLEQDCSFSTLMVYLEAISACHIGIDGVWPGAHPLIICFMKGVCCLKPIIRSPVPSWDLPPVLDALSCSPFGPISVCGRKFLLWLQQSMCLIFRPYLEVLHAPSLHPVTQP